MKRQRKVLLLCVLLLGLLAIPGYGAGLSLSVRAEEQETAKALLVGAMASYFGVDTKVVLDLSKKESDPVSLITAFYLAGETKQPVQKIIATKNKHGWGYIEKHKHRRGPKWKREYERRSNRDWEKEAFMRFVHEYYELPREKVRVWLKYLEPEEIIIAINIAERAKVDVDRVIAQRRRGYSWRTIANSYRIRDWHRPLMRKPRFGFRITINL